MKKIMNVAVTGYYATGSSAVIDLLKEYDTVHIASPTNGDYEHIAFYCNGGVFDLGNILLNNCSPYNSDSAVFNFIKASRKLNNNNFGWFGSYHDYFGDDRFLTITDELVRKISTIKDRTSANHAERVNFSIVKAFLQIAARIVFGRKISKLGRKYYYDCDQIFFSMPTREEFIGAAKKYTSQYMALFGCNNSNISINLFDHLIWPQHTKIIEDYFDDNFKVIIVNRDPRDVYILNKYFLHCLPVSLAKPYFPVTQENFIDEWKRTFHKINNDERILSINFEDLIYNYDNTVSVIEDFCGLQSKEHVYQKKFFDPKRSIENTQTFLAKSEWEKEVSQIQSKLANECYSFPKRRVPDRSKWFDTQDNISRKARK